MGFLRAPNCSLLKLSANATKNSVFAKFTLIQPAADDAELDRKMPTIGQIHSSRRWLGHCFANTQWAVLERAAYLLVSAEPSEEIDGAYRSGLPLCGEVFQDPLKI